MAFIRMIGKGATCGRTARLPPSVSTLLRTLSAGGVRDVVSPWQQHGA
ncbi:hypothetical protein [Streptomyces wuyuanensis]